MKSHVNPTVKNKKALCGLISGLLTLAAGTLTTHATSITEDFDSGSLPGTLEVAGSNAPFFTGGSIYFAVGGRTNVRTVTSDFYDTNFVAEVTLTNFSSIAFFGMGDGSPTGGSNEPASPTINLRMHASGIGIGQNGLNDNYTTYPDMGYSGSGTHRLRLTWDGTAKTAFFDIDEHYAGGAFTVDFTSPVFSGADNGFTTPGTSIFFGGDNNISFDDFTVLSTAAVPEPSTAVLAIGSGAMLLMRRRRPWAA